MDANLLANVLLSLAIQVLFEIKRFRESGVLRLSPETIEMLKIHSQREAILAQYGLTIEQIDELLATNQMER